MVTRKLSVAFIVVTTIIAVTTLMMFLLFLIFDRISTNRWHDDLHKEQTLLADQLSESLALPLWNFDTGEIGRIIESGMKNENIFGIVVKTTGKQAKTFVRMRDAQWRIVNAEQEFPGNGLSVEERDIRFSRERIGTVQVINTPKFVEAFLHVNRILMIAILLPFELVLALSLYLLLRRLVLKPLKEVEAYAGAVSSGSAASGDSPSMLYQGELESLQSSISKMVRMLKKSEEKFSKFFMAAPAGISVSSLGEGRILDVNQEFEKTLGYTRDEIIGRTSFELDLWLDPGDREDVVSLLRANGKVRDQELRIRAKGGKEVTERYSAETIELDGMPYLLSAFVDITQRKYAEEKLRESELRYRTLFESAADAILLMREGRFVDCNAKTEKMFGYPRERILGATPDQFSPPVQPDGSNSKDKALEKIAAALGGQPQFFEWKHSRADGAPFDVEVSLNRVELSSGMHLQAIVRDISEKKRLEDQLRQAQKMEAIGQLAGGVAHDFNNLLTVFMTYGDMLNKKLRDDNVLHSYAERIVEATQKAAGLTQSLLAFSRKQTISLRPVDLNEIIKNVEHFLLRIIGEDVELKTSLAGTALSVMADSGQIEQVMMNLAANARDAMPRGGLLSIHSEAVALGDADVTAGEVERAGAYARISVADTGQGMDKTTAEKIFEPFFTTKAVGKGTGLGLAIVYGIIKQHGGTIRVYSEPGKGTIFKIYLPLTRSATAKLETHVLPAPRGGNETILLAEDNAAVRESLKAILEDGGYHVVEAADGDDAIAEFYRHRDEIALLLTDVIMPKKNGKEVYDMIRSIRPGIRALFISGYTADIITSKGLLDEGLHLMRKPPAPDALKRRVREILDGKRG